MTCPMKILDVIAVRLGVDKVFPPIVELFKDHTVFHFKEDTYDTLVFKRTN